MKKKYLWIIPAILFLAGSILAIILLQKPKITEIEVFAISGEFNYYLGEEFDSANIKVVIKYNNGSSKEAEKDNYTIDKSAYNKNVSGTYDIVVKLNNFDKSYIIKAVVLDLSVNEITLSGYKDIFNINEDFSAGNLVVTKKLSNGTTSAALTSEYTVDSSAFEKGIAGTYDITVKLKNINISATYSVTINEVVSSYVQGIVIKNSKPIYSADEAFDDSAIKVYKVSNTGLPVLAQEEEYIIETDFIQGVVGEYSVEVSLKNTAICTTQNIKISSITEIVDENGGKVSYDIQSGIRQISNFKYLPKISAILNNPEYTYTVLINEDDIFINGRNTAFLTVYTDDTKATIMETAEITFDIDFIKIGWVSLYSGGFKNEIDQDGFLIYETANSSQSINISFNNSSTSNMELYLPDNTPLDYSNLSLNPGDNKILAFITTNDRIFLLKVNIKLVIVPATEITVNGITESLTNDYSDLEYTITSQNEVNLKLNLDMQYFYYQISFNEYYSSISYVNRNELTFPMDFIKCSRLYIYIYEIGSYNTIQGIYITFMSNITDITVNNLTANKDSYNNSFKLYNGILSIDNITVYLDENLTYNLLLDGKEFATNKLFAGVNNIYIQIRNSGGEIIETAVLRLTYLDTLTISISGQGNLTLVKSVINDKTYYTAHVLSQNYNNLIYSASDLTTQLYTFTLLNLNGENVSLNLQSGANDFIVKMAQDDFTAFIRICIYCEENASNYINSADILIDNQISNYAIYQSSEKGYYLELYQSISKLRTSKLQKIYFKEEFSRYTYTYEIILTGYLITLFDETETPVLTFELSLSTVYGVIDSTADADFLTASFTGEYTFLEFNEEKYLALQLATTDFINIAPRNNNANIEISSDNNSLFVLQNQNIYIKGSGESTLTIKIISTDLSVTNIYTLKLSVTASSLLSAKIGDVEYSSIVILNYFNAFFYGDFKFKTDHWGYTDAVLLYLNPKDISKFISDNRLNVTISALDILNIYYDGITYYSTCNLSLPILFNGTQFYASCDLMVSSIDIIPLYFIFEDMEWDMEISFGNEEQLPITFFCPDIYNILGNFMGTDEYYSGILENFINLETINDGYININLKLSNNTIVRAIDQNGQEQTYTNENDLTNIPVQILCSNYEVYYIRLECIIRGINYALIIIFI